jgi:hypothetical protein
MQRALDEVAAADAVVQQLAAVHPAQPELQEVLWSHIEVPDVLDILLKLGAQLVAAVQDRAGLPVRAEPPLEQAVAAHLTRKRQRRQQEQLQEEVEEEEGSPQQAAAPGTGPALRVHIPEVAAAAGPQSLATPAVQDLQHRRASMGTSPGDASAEHQAQHARQAPESFPPVPLFSQVQRGGPGRAAPAAADSIGGVPGPQATAAGAQAGAPSQQVYCRATCAGRAGAVQRLRQPAQLPAVPPKPAQSGKAGRAPRTRAERQGDTWDVAPLLQLLQRRGGCRLGPAAVSLTELVSGSGSHPVQLMVQLMALPHATPKGQ